MNRFRVYATKTLSGTVATPRTFLSCKLSHDFGSAPAPKPAQQQTTVPVADIESDVNKLAALVKSARAATERIEKHVGVSGSIVDDGRKLYGPLYRAIGFDVSVFQKMDEGDVIRQKLASSASGEGEGAKVLERLRQVQGEMGEVLGRLEAVEKESGKVPVGGRGNWRGGRFLDLDCL
ncbi:dual specificity phosphatase [Colletotrichum kahawae]|uniref:Dual specificity phosphatase n=1 Tax=Colletotrichum kahawae TaxID=34407 RepID=A0AAE0CYF7_COLKA|nr:dual specificity phosphatase [Colletotrichum kahawae]